MTFRTITEARTWLRQQDAAISAGEWTSDTPLGRHAVQQRRFEVERAGSQPFEAVAEQYLDELTGAQPDTLAKYRRFIVNDLHNLRQKPVAEIGSADMTRWLRAVEKSGNSAKTITNKHTFISQVFNHALTRGAVTTNPARGLRIARTARKPNSVFTPEEYQQLLAAVTPHYRPLVRTLFETGLRFGEAMALHVSDLDLADLDGASLSVWRSVKQDGSFGPPKTARGRRVVPLTPSTAAMLRDLVVNRALNDLVFVNVNGQPVRQDTFYARWQEALKRSGLAKRLRIHDARHTHASWLLAAGVPIHEVSAQLGHSNIQTTVNTYGHLLPGADERRRAALAQLLTLA